MQKSHMHLQVLPGRGLQAACQIPNHALSDDQRCLQLLHCQSWLTREGFVYGRHTTARCLLQVLHRTSMYLVSAVEQLASSSSVWSEAFRAVAHSQVSSGRQHPVRTRPCPRQSRKMASDVYKEVGHAWCREFGSQEEGKKFSRVRKELPSRAYHSGDVACFDKISSGSRPLTDSPTLISAQHVPDKIFLIVQTLSPSTFALVAPLVKRFGLSYR
jgi:hypothetical protein